MRATCYYFYENHGVVCVQIFLYEFGLLVLHIFWLESYDGLIIFESKRV